MDKEKYRGLKFEQGSFRETEDFLTIEESLQILINRTPFTVTMRTPGNDDELIRGLLFSEDIYKSLKTDYQLEIVQKNAKGITTSVDVKIVPTLLEKEFANNRNLLSVSSCGICGKFELEEIKNKETKLTSTEILNPELVDMMFQKMNAEQKTFRQSGGSHAAAAFTIEGNLLSVMEDIGRHNAVDKVIGDLLLKKQLKDAKFMTVSGRISYEIVNKCFSTGIPFLAAVSAPSSLAVDLAEELGITLIAFSREKKFTVYSNFERIRN